MNSSPVVSVLCSPTIANVGTPLMWLGCGHLVFLNLVIGLGEGWLLARFGRVSFKRAAWVMIAANYVSGFVGLGVLPPVLWFLRARCFDGPPLYRLGVILAAMAGAAWALTVLIELPFVLWALRGSSRGWASKVLAGVWVQCVSYGALAALYVTVSPMTVMTDCTRTRDVAGLAGGAKGWVYYTDEAVAGVWRVRLDGSGNQRFVSLPENARVGGFQGLSAGKADDGLVTLRVSTTGEPEVLATGLAGVIGDCGPNQQPDHPASLWPMDFRPADARPDMYVAHPYAEAGLEHREWYDNESGHWTRTTDRVNFANPLWKWDAAFPTILPDGAVVFEFGGQIVMMDRQRRIGVLAMGRSPVVVIDAASDN